MNVLEEETRESYEITEDTEGGQPAATSEAAESEGAATQSEYRDLEEECPYTESGICADFGRGEFEEEAFTLRGSSASYLASLSVELMEVWTLLHKFVEHHRGSYEADKPLIYKVYDDVCARYNERPRVWRNK